MIFQLSNSSVLPVVFELIFVPCSQQHLIFSVNFSCSPECLMVCIGIYFFFFLKIILNLILNIFKCLQNVYCSSELDCRPHGSRNDVFFCLLYFGNFMLFILLKCLMEYFKKYRKMISSCVFITHV